MELWQRVICAALDLELQHDSPDRVDSHDQLHLLIQGRP